MSDSAGWQRAATMDDLAPGQGYETDLAIDGEVVGLVRVGDQVYAIGECPHEGGPLCQGLIEGGEIACPWHSARFDVTTGACVMPPNACRVDGKVVTTHQDHDHLPPCTTFEVRVTDGDILVRPRRKG